MKRLVILGGLVVGLGVGTALATTMVSMDIPSLARQADVIARGTVTRISPRWTSDRARIVTDVELDLSHLVKGEASSTVIVMYPGGIVGDVGQRVEGVPTFQQGEEVLVFLERRGDRFAVVGMAQGKFRLERSSDGSATIAIPDSAGHTLLLDAETRQPVAQRTKPLRYEELVSQVLSALDRRAPTEESVVPGVQKKGAR